MFKEKIFVIFFCMAGILFPLAFKELYPWTLNPLFSSVTARASYLQLKGPEGYIPLVNLGFRLRYQEGRFDKYGRKPPETVNLLGRFVSRELVEEVLQKHLTRYPQLPSVEVTKLHVGSVEENKVGIIHKETWLVKNKSYNPNAEDFASPYEDKWHLRFKVKSPRLNPFISEQRE